MSVRAPAGHFVHQTLIYAQISCRMFWMQHAVFPVKKQDKRIKNPPIVADFSCNFNIFMPEWWHAYQANNTVFVVDSVQKPLFLAKSTGTRIKQKKG